MKIIKNLIFAGALALRLTATVANCQLGTLDESFDAELTDVGGPPTWPGIVDMALAPDDKIYIGGHAFSANGVNQRGLARLHPDGSLDSAFRAQPSPEIEIDAHQLRLQPDGKVWAGWNNLYRYLATGEFDSEINNQISLFVSGLSVFGIQLDGKLLVGDGPLRRLTTDGVLDPTFKAPANEHVSNDNEGMALQADGKILIVTDNEMMRLHPDGTLDTSFARVNGAAAHDIAVQPQTGKIYCFGTFPSVNGSSRFSVARVNADGSLDSSFIPPPDLNLESVGSPPRLALQSDGKLIIGYNFLTQECCYAGGRLVRLKLDGSLDAVLPFDPGHSQAGPVYRVLVQPDGKILVCGDFTTVNGVPRTGIVRLHGGNPAPALLLGDVRRAGDGGIEFQITGPTNQIIVIEATNDLISPQWTPVVTNQLESGVVTFHEERAASGPQRFYRARF